jgi:hypothetical protein
MVFAPRRPLNETYEICTGDGVMVAYLAPPHAGEQAFRVIRVGLSLVADTIGFFVVDRCGVNRAATAFQEPASSASSVVCGPTRWRME